MFVLYSSMFSMFPSCSFAVSSMFFYVPSMFLLCLFYVPTMFLLCCLYISPMYLYVSSVFLSCFSHVAPMFLLCFFCVSNISSMFLPWLFCPQCFFCVSPYMSSLPPPPPLQLPGGQRPVANVGCCADSGISGNRIHASMRSARSARSLLCGAGSALSPAVGLCSASWSGNQYFQRRPRFEV